MNTYTKKINVALIDSMINPLAFSQNISTFTVTDDSEVIEYKHSISPYNWLHGTICAKILLDLSPNINLICINVFNKINQISFEYLKTAVEFAYKHNCKLINLSLASTHFRDKAKFKNLLERYWDEMIFVTSCSNKGVLSFPAAFSETISVVGATDLSIKPNEFVPNENPLIFADFIARTPQTINLANHDYKIEFPNPNSYATPVITSHIGNILNCSANKNLSLNYVKNLLSLTAVNKDFISIKDNLLLRYERFQEQDICDLSVPVISINMNKCNDYLIANIISSIFYIMNQNGYNPLIISTFYYSNDLYFFNQECIYNNSNKLKCFLESETFITQRDCIIILYHSSNKCIIPSDLDFKISDLLYEKNIGKTICENIIKTFSSELSIP